MSLSDQTAIMESMASESNLHIIESIVSVFAVGALTAYVFRLLCLPSVLGFIFTGVMLGPGGLGLIGGTEIEVLANIGVIFLLFLVGLELSPEKIKQMRFQAPWTGVLQLGLTAVFLTLIFGGLFHMPWQLAFLIGAILSLSSTAIVLRSLEDGSQMDTVHGRLILGVLIIQDLAIIPLMTLVPTLTKPLSGDIMISIGMVLLKALVFSAIAVFASLKLLPRLLDRLAAANQREIFLLTVVTMVLGVSLITERMGLSYEAGAFIAGLSLSGSIFTRQVLADSRTFRDIFVTLFFVSVGLLFDVRFMMDHAGLLLAATAGMIVLKFTGAWLAAICLRFPPNVSVLTGLALFQVGEFSLILLNKTTETVAAVPEWADMMSFWSPLLINVIVLSMFITPIVIRKLPALGHWLSTRHGQHQTGANAESADQLEDLVVVAGYGPVAQNLTEALSFHGIPFRVIEMNLWTIKRLREDGIPCIYGDVTQPDILKAAGITKASAFTITFPDVRTGELALQQAKRLNPDLCCMIRGRYQVESEGLYSMGSDVVVNDEVESSVGFVYNVLRNLGYPMARIDHTVAAIRQREPLPDGAAGQPVFGRFSLMAGTKIEWIELKPGSPLIDQSIAEADIRRHTGATVLSIFEPDTQEQRQPDPGYRLKEGDILVAVGNLEQLHQLERQVGQAGQITPEDRGP